MRSRHYAYTWMVKIKYQAFSESKPFLPSVASCFKSFFVSYGWVHRGAALGGLREQGSPRAPRAHRDFGKSLKLSWVAHNDTES